MRVKSRFYQTMGLSLSLCSRQGSTIMLFLSAIIRLAVPREPESNDLLVRSRMGHVAFTVIALVYVLVTLWQR